MKIFMWLFFGIVLTHGTKVDSTAACTSCINAKELRDLSSKLTRLLPTNFQSDQEALKKEMKKIITKVGIVVDKISDNLLSDGIDGDANEIKIITRIDGDNTNLSRSNPLSGSLFLQALMKPQYKYLMSDDPNVGKNNDYRILKQFQEEFPSTTNPHMRPADCSDLLITGNMKSGIYTIYPFRCFCSPGIKVYCDMETTGGGWTVLLNRQNQTRQENFKRTWEDYKDGFGTAPNEYWLGNEALYMMTNSREYSLRVDASISTKGWSIWGEWSNFKVASEDLKYKLSVTGFNPLSPMYDRLVNLNNYPFTTIDRDNDKHKYNCAEKYKGGGGFWYYASCSLHDFTQKYGSINFNPWSRTDSTARFASHVQMKIRPKICSAKISVASLNSHNCHTPTF